MKNTRWLPLLLATIVVALNATLFIHEHAEREGEEEEEGEATFSEAALQQRRLMLQDARGRMPDADALMRARRQADSVHAAARLRRQALREPAANEDEAVATTGAFTTASSASAAWRWLGPNIVGGRVRTIAVDPHNANVIFVGSAGGGIWKTTNRGASWLQCDDFMAALSVSSIVIDPRNSNVLYASTGEPFHNGDSILGAGVFKSTDGGATWPRLAATDPNVNPDFRLSSRLALSPDGAVLLVSTTFGIYRSTNGGASFVKTSTVQQVTQVAFNPANAAEAMAAGYLGHPLYSRDGGVTWTVSAGFSSVPSTSRVEVAYSRSDGSIYASVDVNSGAVYRSFDGGASFATVSSASTLGYQGFYDNAIWVNPRDANHVIIGGVLATQSFDGGVTWKQMDANPYHPDYHAIVEDAGFDDVSNRTVYLGNDGGVYRAADVRNTGPMSSGRYERLNNNLGITQFYGAAGNVASGEILGGTQDNGSLRYSPASGTSWTSTGGGDVGIAAADRTDPNYFYEMAGYLSIYRTSTRGASWESLAAGISDGTAANFIAPMLLDPNDPQRLYAAGNDLWRTDGAKGASPNFYSVKAPISAGQNYISAVAVADGNSNVVWVGYNYGDVYTTTNGTSWTPTWTRVTTFGSYISRITIDPSNPQDVFVARTGYQPDNVQHTTDGGATWIPAAGSGSSALPFAPVYDVESDPQHPNTVFAATEVGVFVSDDRGRTWDTTGEGPANVRVYELFWMGRSLIAVTHGRGLFALDVDAAGTPGASPSPSSVAFGTQTVSTTSAARTVTITSNGTAPLVVQSVALSGPQAAEFSIAADGCSGATVAPGGGCAVQVKFRPTAAGTRSASLVLADNAASSPQTVSLTGTGATVGGTLPSPWSGSDIGAVGVAGSATYSSGTFTVSGSGADIWGTADAFRFASQPISGDVTIVARVASVQNVNAWTKAGVMIRQSLTASSAHASMFVSPGKGLAFQRRASSGASSVSTAASGAAPRWVKLSRIGQSITAFASTDGSSWTTVGQQSIAMTGTIYVGLVVSSHDNAQAAAATFDSVTVSPGTSAAALPAGWQDADIGSVGVAGSASASSGTFTVKGAGADVWNTADAFHYAYTTLAGDGEIVARVTTVQNVAAWTKAGVMIRGSLSASAPQAFMIVSAGKGLAFQRRTSGGGASTTTAGGAGTAPYWVRLKRQGTTVTAFVSTDGATWTTIGQDTFAISGSVFIGLAVSSHDTTRAATATFDNVVVR